MLMEAIFQPFVEKRPICVMARGILERMLDNIAMRDPDFGRSQSGVAQADRRAHEARALQKASLRPQEKATGEIQ